MKKRVTDTKNIKANIFIIIGCIFFLIISIYTYIDGWKNITQLNYLKKHGIYTQITITDKWEESVGDSDTYYYVFSYTINGENCSFEDTSERQYDKGETFYSYIDPQNPEVVTLPKSSMAFAFLLFLLAVGWLWMFFSPGFTKFVPYLYISEGCIMIITGFILNRPTMIILNVIFIAIVLVISLIIRNRRKKLAKK